MITGVRIPFLCLGPLTGSNPDAGFRRMNRILGIRFQVNRKSDIEIDWKL